jgi:hypothetical protein
MSNGNVYERLFKLQAKINDLILERKRNPETLIEELNGLYQRSLETPAPKFALFVDLGVITVPRNYDHATQLVKFHEKHQGGKKKSFYFYNNDITDKNFPNPSRILKPSDKLSVRVFQQDVGGTTTSKERMDFLATQNAVHTGAQGLSLVFEQKCNQLPKGKSYASFDEPDRLWKDCGGYRRVPGLDRSSGGVWSLHLGNFFFESDWSENHCFLCLCDLLD